MLFELKSNHKRHREEIMRNLKLKGVREKKIL